MTTDHPSKLEVLLEVARRANWDALHGPVHLRNGRFRPDPEAAYAAPVTGASSLADGDAQEPPDER